VDKATAEARIGQLEALRTELEAELKRRRKEKEEPHPEQD